MAARPERADNLEDQIREAVWTVSRSSFTALRESLREAGLSPPQYWVLQMVESADTLSTSEISGRLGVRLPTATGLIDLLVEQGWARREPSSEDRRRVQIRLTAQGSRLLRSIRGQLRATWHRRLGAIPAVRQAEMLKVLTELETRIESEPARWGLCRVADAPALPSSRGERSRRPAG